MQNEDDLTRDFLRRMKTYSMPKSFLEGAMKGVAYCMPALLAIAVRDTPEKTMLFLLAAGFMGGSVGLKRQERPNHQLCFWERAISPVAPQTKGEGLVKGFSAAMVFSWMLQLYGKFERSPENLPIFFMMCMMMAVITTGTLAWGHTNEMRRNRPGNR